MWIVKVLSREAGGGSWCCFVFHPRQCAKRAALDVERFVRRLNYSLGGDSEMGVQFLSLA